MSSTNTDPNAKAASGASPGEAGVLRADLGDGVFISLSLPQGAREERESALPVIEVGGLPGASVALRRGFTSPDGVIVRAACVRGPSDRWAPGVEGLVLGRATGIAREAIDAPLDRWDAGPIQAIGDRFEQRLEGEGRAGESGPALAARGRHLLGFVGEARDVVVCSVVCVERRGSSATQERCSELVDAASAGGSLTPPPAPSVMIRAILLAAERPREALAVSFAVTLCLVAIVLARRPRPRP